MSHTEDLALENNSAAAASTVRVADRVVLDALYNATGGRNWSHQRDWLSGEPIGDWYGVTTDGIGRVTALDLYQNHLTGTIPPELAGRPSLKQLHLSGPPSLRRRRPFSLGPAAGPPLSLTTLSCRSISSVPQTGVCDTGPQFAPSSLFRSESQRYGAIRTSWRESDARNLRLRPHQPPWGLWTFAFPNLVGFGFITGRQALRISRYGDWNGHHNSPRGDTPCPPRRKPPV